MTQGDIRSADPTWIVVCPTVQDRRSFHSSKSREGTLLHGTLGFLEHTSYYTVYKICNKHEVWSYFKTLYLQEGIWEVQKWALDLADIVTVVTHKSRQSYLTDIRQLSFCKSHQWVIIFIPVWTQNSICQLSTWRRVLKKLRCVHLLKKLPDFYETKICYHVHISPLDPILNQLNPSYTSSFFNTVAIFLHLDHTEVSQILFFPSGFLTQILCTILNTFNILLHFIILAVIMLTIFGEEYNLWNSSMCSSSTVLIIPAS